MSLTPGSRIGPYEVLERLGAGGMGEVFRARDPRLSRFVAIKVLGRSVLGNPESLRRFLGEAQAASALNHPNILTVHEIGESEAGPYIVTEFVDGETVRALLRDGPFPLERALDVALDVSRGLAKAHDAGIVHRDIKPENVMVTRDGHAKILDFGLAKVTTRPGPAEDLSSVAALTAPGAIVGTPAYLAPEQLEGQPADARSDVYALALVIHEMISGRHPFARATVAESLKAILHDDVPRLDAAAPGTPPAVAAVVARCLDRDPARRPASARALFEELTRLRGSGSTAAEAGDRGRPRVAIGIAAAAAVAAAAIAIASLLFHPSSGPSSGAGSAASETDPPFRLPEGREMLAVLPVRDDTGDADLAAANVGEILADALVQVLSDRSELYVASPARIEAAAATLGRPLGDAGSDRALARRLGEQVAADVILTGSLTRAGASFRLEAELIDVPTGTVAASFAAESARRDRMLDELVPRIAGEVGRRFDVARVDSLPSLEEVATRSVAAYAHFVRGMTLTYAGAWSEAVPELQHAVAIDPQMGIAWTELACAYSFAGDEASSIAAQHEAERLRERVNRKERMWIELNGIWVNTGNGEAYLEAARAFVAAFPDEREGYFYAGLGAEHLLRDYPSAIEWYERAYRLTPIFYPITKGLADCHVKLGRRDRAIEALRRYLALGAAGAHGRSQATTHLERLVAEG